MAKVTIKINDNILASAIALWFESGQGLDAFSESSWGKNAVEAGAGIITDNWCDVDFDGSEFMPEHEVNIETE